VLEGQKKEEEEVASWIVRRRKKEEEVWEDLLVLLEGRPCLLLPALVPGAVYVWVLKEEMM